MSGIRYGPMEIFVNCDWEPGCNAQALVWSGDPEDGTPDMPLPKGWVGRDAKTYCPKHA